MAVNWKGDELKAKVQRASMLAVDATMAAAIIHAKSNHGIGAHAARRFITHTGELERSTRIIRHARREATGVVGRWGTQGVAYARRIELGFQGKDSAGRSVKAPAYPYLRPAAQAEYPKLAGRIRTALAYA